MNIGWSDEKAVWGRALEREGGGVDEARGKMESDGGSPSSVDPVEVNPAASVQTDRTSQQWKLKVIQAVTHFLSNITWRSLFRCGKSN